MHKQRLAVLIASGIGVVAMFLPWVKAYTLILYGNDAAGFIPIACFAVAAYFAYSGDRNIAMEQKMVKGVAIAGGICTLFMIWKLFVDIKLTYAAIGAYLTILAGIVVLAVPFVIKDSGDFQMPTKESIKDEFNDMKNS